MPPLFKIRADRSKIGSGRLVVVWVGFSGVVNSSRPFAFEKVFILNGGNHTFTAAILFCWGVYTNWVRRGLLNLWDNGSTSEPGSGMICSFN